jgi:hypothetical protein
MTSAAASKGDLILAIIGAVSLIGIVVVAAFAIPNARDMRRSRVEAEIKQMPDKSVLLAAMKRNFPADYAQVEAEARAQEQSFGAPANGARRFDVLIRQLIKSKQRLALSAPDAALARLSGPQVAYYDFLKDFDVDLCARYSTSGLTFEDAQQLAGTEGIALDQAVTATLLDAAGQGNPAAQVPLRFQLRPEDGDAILAQLRRQGTEPRLIALLTRPQGAIGAPPADACATGVAVAQTMKAMPPRIAAAWYRYNLSSR